MSLCPHTTLAPKSGTYYIRLMRIIARKTLVDFWSQPSRGDAKADLTAWFNAVNGPGCDWATPADVKASYRNASIVADNRVVFNIHGNTYRLVVKINYPYRVVYIRWIGTHAAYDKIDVTKV
ncbi:MAG: type II toxin-antitoxin system HigB family toxin [Nisaea sp.]